MVAEANALAPGWGQTIFQSAGEMIQNQLVREKLANRKETIPAEKKVWEETRERARRELEGDDKKPQVKPQPVPAAPEPTTTTETTTANSNKPMTADSSDEDAVIVETPGADNSTAAGGGSGKKKKKNKK